MNLTPIYDALWFVLPLYIANMAPVFVKKLNFLNYPVDFNKTFYGKRILGDHKTWRGLIFGTVAGGLTSLLQSRGIFIGLILGLGALFGDMIGSSIKRRLNIPEGEKLLGIDQLDFLLGGLLLVFLFKISDLQPLQILFLIFITPLGHYLTSVIGYKLKLKDVPW